MSNISAHSTRAANHYFGCSTTEYLVITPLFPLHWISLLSIHRLVLFNNNVCLTGSQCNFQHLRSPNTPAMHCWRTGSLWTAPRLYELFQFSSHRPYILWPIERRPLLSLIKSCETSSCLVDICRSTGRTCL